MCSLVILPGTCCATNVHQNHDVGARACNTVSGYGLVRAVAMMQLCQQRAVELV